MGCSRFSGISSANFVFWHSGFSISTFEVAIPVVVTSQVKVHERKWLDTVILRHHSSEESAWFASPELGDMASFISFLKQETLPGNSCIASSEHLLLYI